jgi:DUF4097 and DUF4098 domain-containing protein YvlB
MKRLPVVSIIFTLCCIAFAGVTAYAAEEEFHRSFSVSPTVTVDIRNINGNIQVHTWDRSVIEVDAVKKTNRGKSELDRAEIRITEGDDFRIETILDKNRRDADTFFKRIFRGFSMGGANVSVDYNITIPASCTLSRAGTTNGNVRVYGTRGDSRLTSTNGNVFAENANGNVEASTTNGDIEVAGTSAVSKARTTNGSIKAVISDRLERDVDLSSTNGSITIVQKEDIDAVVDLKTTNGSVSAAGFTITMNDMKKNYIN